MFDLFIIILFFLLTICAIFNFRHAIFLNSIERDLQNLIEQVKKKL